MRVLRIPDEEKAKGMMWVLYPIINCDLIQEVHCIEIGQLSIVDNDRFDFRIIGFAELQIRQGKN